MKDDDNDIGTTVITAEEARKITRGRTPLVPVEYEQAIRNLIACTTLDETKYWSTKADVLAAWAKIYHSDRAGIEAKRLKLHAFRRMGEIARELQPGGTRKGLVGIQPGPGRVLSANGLSRAEKNAALALSKLPNREFESLVASPSPPSLYMATPRFSQGVSSSWKIIAGGAGGQSLMGFCAWCRRQDAKMLAKGLSRDEGERAQIGVREIIDWLDKFEQHLPKERKGDGK